ncbi:V-set and transmembrane domain-containing protein 4 isoform X2 [Ambystoma mexicanum]|uniref:V-set and transmembrane domain-containing protein 4 isoform X2 n=1 Tax=Ambystoma mexicanum TaxID=8296 RepID=UPI0037E759FC
MPRFLVTLALLTEALAVAGVGYGLNVTVAPGPSVHFWEGGNASLVCHVSQKKRPDNLLAVRWVFSRSPGREQIMIKMNKFGTVQHYGNYSHPDNRQRLLLREEQAGRIYRLLLSNLRLTDQGHYTCRVQEIGKHRSRWTAWSNGSSGTELIDLYVYAVLLCCTGILSILLFALVVLCQSLSSRRKTKVRHYLVRHPQNSSGETVTSVSSLSPLQPKKKRKQKPEHPPAVPLKAPVVDVPPGPRLLKHHTGKIALPRITEESLTYAELELMKPPPPAKGQPTSTVYAQILFEENTI